MSRGWLIAVGAVAAVVVAGVVVWFVVLRDTAEPVSVEEAVTSFQSETEPVPEGPSPIPEGVYVYRTRGVEHTDALTGVTHRYPKRTTIAVRRAPCGVSLLWRVFEGRSTEWTFCVTSRGWEFRSQDERHTFFGRTERTTYTCRNTPIRPFGRPVGYRWPVRCSTDGAREQGTASIVERRSYSLKGGPSSTEVHVRKVTRFSGRIRGTARYDFWFDGKSGVPVNITMVSRTTNGSPVGDVTYDEDVGLALTSLEPRR